MAEKYNIEWVIDPEGGECLLEEVIEGYISPQKETPKELYEWEVTCG